MYASPHIRTGRWRPIRPSTSIHVLLWRKKNVGAENVILDGPQEFAQPGALQDGSAAGCMSDEKACGSNECVKAAYVCDGEPDCRDRSDEMVGLSEFFAKIIRNTKTAQTLNLRTVHRSATVNPTNSGE